jgi:hypothetical protein
MTTGNRTHDRRGQYPPVFTAWLAIRYLGPVCERWRSFPSFYLDVGPRPSRRHLLIRNDTAGDFEPGNVRWRIAAWTPLRARSRLGSGAWGVGRNRARPPQGLATRSDNAVLLAVVPAAT